MKKSIFLLLIIFTFSTISASAQNAVSQRLPANEKAIPKVVLSTFKEQYRDVLLIGWYSTHLTYWQNDYSSDWYYGWYGQRTVVVYTYQKPTYYEVEFSKEPGQVSRAIYNLHGYWYETRTQFKVLPEDIDNTLKSSKYVDWKVSRLKEKIESQGWPGEIYRFQVSKGLKSRIIRMDASGNFIQIREIDE